MNLSSLISQSHKYYWRYHRLVALAVILMMAVLSGSLFLGDSVRGTLVQRVTERLGQTETIVTSGTGFMNEDIMRLPLMDKAEGCLLVDGFVSMGDKLLPVYVWGTDADSLNYGDALVNEPLARKLTAAVGDSQFTHSSSGDEDGSHEQQPLEDIVLHLPSHNLVPSGTLFVTQSYATQMRLHISGQKSVEEGGNLLLKNEQTLPLNVFVNRQQLAEVMELEGKINLILSQENITEKHLAEVWTPDLSGIHITDSSLTYDGIFIPNEVVESIQSPQSPTFAVGQNAESKDANGVAETGVTLYFSYLVNDLICQTDTVPYSFVTSVTDWKGEALTGRDIILSDYAAEHLHVEVGDSIRMSYFLAKDLKNLETREQMFRVKQIVPLTDFMQDSLLMAEFPGLSNVERCTDWDSDLPIKMDRVHKIDEDYWYKYRQLPKAIVAYDAVKGDWANAFGSATAIRFSSPDSHSFSPSGAGFLLVIHPRQEGLNAATSGVDFASLFLALGAFIIMAAIMLMASPLQEMFAQRKAELLLFRQLGFRQQKIRRTLFREAFGTMLLASPLGVLAGLLYSGLTLWLLGNVWSGATHTEGFALHLLWRTAILAWVVGLLICGLTLWYIIRRMLQEEVAQTLKPQGTSRQWVAALILCAITIALIAANFVFLHSMMLFILCGLLWVVVFGLFLRAYILYKVVENSISRNSRTSRVSRISRDSSLPRTSGIHSPSSSLFSRTQLTWHSIRASLRQHLLAYWSLSLGVFTVFAVGLNRPDFGDAEQLAGGYQLYVESRVPIQYDLNNPAVRRKLSLDALPDSTHFLLFLRHTQDEASCLNLNKVSTPTVLAATAPPTPEGEKGWLDRMLELQNEGTSLTPCILPVGKSRGLEGLSRGMGGLLLDQESLIWSLMKSVGDTLHYQDGRGETVPVVISGTYPTGIFHGNGFMPYEQFRQMWPKETGVEVMLVKSSRPEEAEEILSMALSEYGLTIQTVDERLQMFFEVTETYLIIFLTLGGLGLLLGIFSLVIIVRKNLTALRPTILQMRAMGFSKDVIQQILLRENILVPYFAICVGVVGSFISISANVGGAGITTFLSSFLLLALLLLLIYFGIRKIIKTSLANIDNQV